MSVQLYSYAEQAANYLRAEIEKGRWTNAMPGILSLGKELGINHNTIDSALQLLEKEGVLSSQGKGKPRLIVLDRSVTRQRLMKVTILPYDDLDRSLVDTTDLLARLQAEGVVAGYAEKSLHDLGMDEQRVARFVRKNPADAWVVIAGSRGILQWFAAQPTPAIAMYGRFSGLPIAASSPKKTPALVEALKKLVGLGHHRIVMISREERRVPTPALFEQNFLNELAALGVEVGPYNLPDWEDNPAGLRDCLESLFLHTPPTAIFVNETGLFLPIYRYLSRRGILVPEHVSLISLDPDPGFTWCDPIISHINWNYLPVIQRVMRWANNVAEGKEDLKQSFAKAEFVEGGTIGPA